MMWRSQQINTQQLQHQPSAISVIRQQDLLLLRKGCNYEMNRFTCALLLAAILLTLSCQKNDAAWRPPGAFQFSATPSRVFLDQRPSTSRKKASTTSLFGSCGSRASVQPLTTTDNSSSNNGSAGLLLNRNTKQKIAGSVAKGERRAFERSFRQRRDLCGRCQRPLVQCVCEYLPKNKIRTKNTDVLILQHPTEFRRKTFSTVPLIPLVLENVQICVGRSFDLETRPIKNAIAANSSNFLLLFPGRPEETISLDDAADGDSNPVRALAEPAGNTTEENSGNGEEEPNKAKRKNLLILVDGTWTQARRMVRNSPSLLGICQQVQLNALGNSTSATSSSSSIYDAIRKEPEGNCLSTLEACAKALLLLEGPTAQTASDHLHAALQSLVDTQLRYTSSSLSSSSSQADPRFVGGKAKVLERKRRRLELERQLFGDATDDMNEHQAVLYTKDGTDNGLCRSSGSSASEFSSPNQVNEQQVQTKDGFDEQCLSGNKVNYFSSSERILLQEEPASVPPVRIQQLEDGATLRALRTGDATFVDSRWPHRSKKSLAMISRRLQRSATTASSTCCLGVYGEDGGGLRGFIMRYENGALGMLHVEEGHRRKGYATALLKEATRRLRSRDEPCFAYILDGNAASEALFAKLGWVREDRTPYKRRGTGRRRAKRKWIKP